MHWIHKEYRKKAKTLEREIRKVRNQLRMVEQEGYFSDREMDEKESRMEALRVRVVEFEREINLLWHLDKGGTVRGETPSPKEDEASPPVEGESG